MTTPFDPNDPKLLTAEQKLFNMKVRVNSIKRTMDKIVHDPAESSDAVRLAHMVKAALVEIESELNRTV